MLVDTVAKTQCGNGAAAVAKGSHKSQKVLGGSGGTTATNNLSTSGGSAKDADQLTNWTAKAADLAKANPSLADELEDSSSSGAKLANLKNSSRVIVKDDTGQVQAGAKIIKRKDSFYLESLVASPSSVAGKDANSGKAAVLASVVQKSMKAGFGGKVDLVAHPRDSALLKSLGFKETGSGQFSLTSGDAKSFMKSYEKQYGQSN